MTSGSSQEAQDQLAQHGSSSAATAAVDPSRVTILEGRRLTSGLLGAVAKPPRSRSPQSPRHSPSSSSAYHSMSSVANQSSPPPPLSGSPGRVSMGGGSPSSGGVGAGGGSGGRPWVDAMKGACDRTRDRTRGLLRKFRNSEHSMTVDSGMGRMTGPRRSVSIDMDPVTTSADSHQHGQGHHHHHQQQQPQQTQSSSTDSSWTVHVWSTWVSRPSMDEDDFNMALMCGDGGKRRGEPRKDPELSLSQRRKLTCFFACFYDRDKDGFITVDDLNSLAEKIRHYTDWTPDHEDFVAVVDMHREIWAHFKPMKTKLAMSSKKKTSVLTMYAHDSDDDPGVDVIVTEPELIDLASWLQSWKEIVLTSGSAVHRLPDWILLLVKILFRTINRRGNGRLSVAELRDFYSCFLGVAPSAAHKMAKQGYLSMTGDGQYVLDLDSFLLVFANFLFGRSDAMGPGRYIMPCCLEEDKPFRITPAPQTPERKPKFDPLNDPDLRH